MNSVIYSIKLHTNGFADMDILMRVGQKAILHITNVHLVRAAS